KRNAGGTNLVRAVVDAIRETGTERQILLSSFDHKLVADARRTASDIERAVLMRPIDIGVPSKAALRVGARTIVMSRRQLTTQRVTDARAKGLQVFVYTVDAERDVARCVRLGVDAIITNAPAATRRLVTAMRMQRNATVYFAAVVVLFSCL
ncbi:MAG: glycerophosphodiester phosphodiesterase, partial [bacterium]|nr:glycerophosphodiester phosphodiesterase [Candidatus Kapabacteria bacterium]